MEMAFNIKAAENGFSATLDVPAQGAFDVPVDKTVFQDNHLQLTLSAMGASYSGTLKGEAIEGEFTQHGMTFPLNLAKGEKEAPKARPQDTARRRTTSRPRRACLSCRRSPARRGKDCPPSAP